jgi:glutamyl-tRNA synthetase
MEYARQGYLPEAMMNFLTLLGWSPGSGDREIFTRDELIERFDLGGISGASAVFNPEKLDWFNQQHLLRLAPDELVRRLQPVFAEAGLWNDEYVGVRHAWFLSVLELLKPRARRLGDFVSVGRFFFADSVEFDQQAVAKHLRVDGMGDHLAALDSAFAALTSFDVVSVEEALRGVAASRGVKPAALIHAVRVALTGRTVSPGLFEVAALLGRERTRARLRAAMLGPSTHLV